MTSDFRISRSDLLPLSTQPTTSDWMVTAAHDGWRLFRGTEAECLSWAAQAAEANYWEAARCKAGTCDHYTCTEGESLREWEASH